MREVIYSTTAIGQLRLLLAQGIAPFGPRVVAEKRDLVFDTIERFLAQHPSATQPHPSIGLVVYPIARTPFVVLYNYDDQVLRVHFIMHQHASLDDLDPKSVQW